MENRTPAVQIAYEKCEGERRRRMLTELKKWIKSCEDANAAMSDFNKYVFCEFPEELEREKWKIVTELQEKEDECRWTLAMEIGFSVSIDEFEEVDMAKPGQIIGWAIKQGVSENPTRRRRWAWFREEKGSMIHWAGSAEYEQKPNPKRAEQIKRIKAIRAYFPAY
jgi:hypothetical protein